MIITKPAMFRVTSASRSGSMIYVGVASNLDSTFVCNLFNGNGLNVASKHTIDKNGFVTFLVDSNEKNYKVQCSAFSPSNARRLSASTESRVVIMQTKSILIPEDNKLFWMLIDVMIVVVLCSCVISVVWIWKYTPLLLCDAS